MAEFYGYFLNSVIVTVGTLVISISIGCLAGYGLARYSGILGVVILVAALGLPRTAPDGVRACPTTSWARCTGLYDTYLLLILTLVAVNQPFTIWMLRSFFMEIPREIEEAAMMDGAGRLQSFLRVIVPITWPGIITHGPVHPAAGLQRVSAGAHPDPVELDAAGGDRRSTPAARTPAIWRSRPRVPCRSRCRSSS